MDPNIEILPHAFHLPWRAAPLVARLKSAAVAAAIASLVHPLRAQVGFGVGVDRVDIAIGGRPFSVLHFGTAEHKPFLHPLLAPSGQNVLRGFPIATLAGEPMDRPHQRGCWIGSEGVIGPNGKEDFWENDPLYEQAHKGVIQFDKLLEAKSGDDQGRLVLQARWISAEGQVWLNERRTMTFYSKPENCRMFDIEIDLEAVEPVTFDDVQDAVLGMRLALPFDTNYGGSVQNDKGLTGEEIRGQRSSWIDWIGNLGPYEYSSSTHGHGQLIGVAIFDHPSNLHYPSRWQVRSFGDYSVNPFAGEIFQRFDKTARNNAYPMKPGDKLHLRYRVLIHPEAVKVDPFFKDWANQK